MTLADDKVREVLKDRFVVGWKNVMNEQWVGQSHGYSRRQQAVGTTNGAGGRNVQIFVLSPDLVVLHALPGFWHPDDLLGELRFAEAVWSVWKDESLTRAQKEAFHRQVQLQETRHHGEETFARSGWQHFDRHVELARLKEGNRDTVACPPDEKGQGFALKSHNVLLHERMAEHPFVRFAEFDVTWIADYGQAFYDNNRGVGEDGISFPSPQPKLKSHWL